MPNSFPSKTMDITDVVDFMHNLWNLIFSALNNVKFRFGAYQFSILSIFIALMVLSIVSAVVLNLAKSSATGAEKSVTRADRSSDLRKKGNG